MSRPKKAKAANRPLKYGERTELVPVRVPVSKKAAFKKKVKEWLKQYIVKKLDK